MDRRTAIFRSRWLTNLVIPGIGSALAILGTGCIHTPAARDRATVSADLQHRTGHAIDPVCWEGDATLPYRVSLANGFSEDEAVLVALWKNAAFQELLTDLRIARGDLIQAGLLPNPELVWLFHVADKPYRYLLDFPLESLWLRPIRVAAAERESARTGQRLAQAGLDLIRDVRQAYADTLLAQGRLRVATESVRLRSQVSEFADARLKAGDASVQEAATARIDALRARQEQTFAGYDVRLAEERLRNLMGIPADRSPMRLDDSDPPRRPDPDLVAIEEVATRSRPDLLAAEEAVAGAVERLRLTRLGWVRLLGIADATAGDRTGHELGPGMRVTVPLFNRNEGNLARAEAELDKARLARQTLHDRILMEVRQAHHRHAQARAELEILEGQVQPEVEAAIRRAESAYKEGNTPYLVVLETTRQFLDSHSRREQLRAELRRAWADLERSVGRRLDGGVTGSPVQLTFQEKDKSP